MKTRKTVMIELPRKLVEKAQERLEAREMDLSEYIAVHLRVMLRNKNVLSLEDIMPFGKYSGEIVENVVRADPRYMVWLLAQDGKCSFSPEVMALVDRLGDVA